MQACQYEVSGLLEDWEFSLGSTVQRGLGAPEAVKDIIGLGTLRYDLTEVKGTDC